METVAPRFTLASLAQVLGGDADGPEDTPLARPASAGDDDPLGVTFAENDRYLALAESSDIGAIIVSHDARKSAKPLIRVSNPRLAFGQLLHMSDVPMRASPGNHPTAVIAQDAVVDPSARVGAYAVIESGAAVGAGAQIFPFCYVGEDCSVGAGAVLFPHVVLYRNVSIGENSRIHSGVVLGADGFGYVWDGRTRVKVPQVGSVQIGSDVEIGANTTVDRATAGSTRVGEGTKIDNLVQIAHNVVVGPHGVIAAQSGISGSTRVGARVVMGGNVGTADHVNIGDDVILAGRSSVGSDIDEPGAYLGTPARPISEAKRAIMIATKLPELLARIRTLEKKIEELESGR
jgi:UDP-3-O-[3-hydroxymyristoyl] glucosamine N-acyltransferase